MKTSEWTSGHASLGRDGPRHLPAGVGQVVDGNRSRRRRGVIDDPKNVGGIAFPGSTAVGRRIADYARRSMLKRVQPELGGIDFLPPDRLRVRYPYIADPPNGTFFKADRLGACRLVVGNRFQGNAATIISRNRRQVNRALADDGKDTDSRSTVMQDRQGAFMAR